MYVHTPSMMSACTTAPRQLTAAGRVLHRGRGCRPGTDRGGDPCVVPVLPERLALCHAVGETVIMLYLPRPRQVFQQGWRGGVSKRAVSATENLALCHASDAPRGVMLAAVVALVGSGGCVAGVERHDRRAIEWAHSVVLSAEPGWSACCYWNGYAGSAATRLKDGPVQRRTA